MKTTSLGFAAALAANILWGASFVASKTTLTAWGPLGASALRFILASFLLGVGLIIAGRKIRVPRTPRAWLRVVSVAVVGFGLLYPIQLAGLKFVSAGFSAAIMLTSPLFVILGGAAFLGEFLSRRKLAAIALGMGGGLVLLSESLLGISSVGADFLMGSILSLVASLCLAASVILTRRATSDLDAGSLTFWTMFLGAAFIGVCAIVFEPEFSMNSLQSARLSAWAALIFLAVVCSALCFFLWNFALSKASPKDIASTMHIKTPTAILLGSVLASEAISTSLVAGTLLVSVGLYLSQKKDDGYKRT